MKNKFLFVLALLSVLTISGCKDKEETTGTTLSAPQQITVQSNGYNSLIVFDEVKNADYYNIYINDVCVSVKSSGTGTIQFDASKIITLPQKYTIKVKAGADNHFDSEFTKEYQYNHTTAIDAPVISIDGTTLNWDKIENAEFYDVVITTYNPTIETTHRTLTNKFEFSNMLANRGEYMFKVRSINESGDYLSSEYSNNVTYVNTQTLETPHNLKIDYSEEYAERVLSFVSSEDVNSFTINLNGTNYILEGRDLENFICRDDFHNVYIIKITSFARYKGLNINCSTILNVSVKANSITQYVKSSQFSNSISCQFTEVLNIPSIGLVVNNDIAKITITSNNDRSEYLSGHAIYLDGEKYKTLNKSITELELPVSVINDRAVRVQAISNNRNCYSSNLSEAKYVRNKTKLDTIRAEFNNGIVSWNPVEYATLYYAEILNKTNRYALFTNGTSVDFQDAEYGQYKLRVIAMGQGYNQSEIITDITYNNKLNVPQNVIIESIGDRTYLNFDAVENTYGYILSLNGTQVNKLFTETSINLGPYISDINTYNVKIKAVGTIKNSIIDSDFSSEQVIQSIKTLSAPNLSITQEDGKYYLNITVNNEDTELSKGYEVWINYKLVYEESRLQNAKKDITSYFTNAGQYNFMVKALAIDSPYVKDSNMSSLVYNCIKQLDIVTDIKVTKLEDESKYILTFKEQSLAAKYLVTIKKDDDNQYNVAFEINNGVADISAHLIENGVYRVDVQALAKEGSYYSNSVTGGKPYKLTKGETLSTPENIEVKTNMEHINLTWDKVENSSNYQVYVYYHAFGQKMLKKSIFVAQSNNPSVDIGYGEHLCLNKEGTYSIEIKAVGDGEKFENSQTANASYEYVMKTSYDFSRNSIFIAGNTYSYKIENATQLKSLLWHHYLYNDDVWAYGDLGYNLKIYYDGNLNELAYSISENLGIEIDNVSQQVAGQDVNKQKMDIIARALLNQYPEVNSMTLGYSEDNKTQSFCLVPTTNVYIFRYQNNLDDLKQKTQENSTATYNEKISVVDALDQRKPSYTFNIDKQTSIDVTTTEQLFMALQYNKQPNFVGDCEVAKAVYDNARFILRQICADDMSEYQKVLQIYDFLTKRISWNNVTTGSFDEMLEASDNSQTMRANLKDLHLESVLYNYSRENGLFYDLKLDADLFEDGNYKITDNLSRFNGLTADSEGLSKVFVVLCAIEGIDAIKVTGQKTIIVDENPVVVDYSWNKVYIDIDEDGVDGKRWYVVDVTSGITNTISFQYDGKLQKYQVATHKHFLTTDSLFGIQTTSLHKRLGDSTDYIANTSFDYYNYQRYSCVYRGNKVVDNANLKASIDTDIVNAMVYASLKANNQHRIILDIDAGEYMSRKGEASLSSIKADVSNLYNNARTMLGEEYTCNIQVTIIDYRYIVIVLQGSTYSE